MFETDLKVDRKRRFLRELSDDLKYIQDVLNRTRENIESFSFEDLGEFSQAVSDLRYRASQVDLRISLLTGQVKETEKEGYVL